MAEDKLFKKVKDWIVSLGVPDDAVTLDAELVEDLRMDSLDLVELAMGIEEEFFDSEPIPDEDAEKWNTVGDVVNYLKTQQQKGNLKS